MQASSTPADGRLEIFNPATDEPLGFVPINTEAEVQAAIDRARTAQPAWARRSDDERKQIVNQVADALEQHSEALALWVTREQGKPLSGPGSRFELQACAGWTRAAAALELPAETVYEDDERRDVLHRQPLGVVAAIAPWNWPLMIATWQIMPAIRMGNSVVLKPSEYTSLATLELVRVINEVLPEGVLNIVTGGGDVGGWLTGNQHIDKIMFTGSEATGRKVVEASGNSLSPVTLELGGNDAAVVLPGTAAQDIAGDLFWGAFLNMGQTCACAKRVYVHEDDYDAVRGALADVAKQIPIGNGEDESILFGPIQNKMQYDKVTDLLQDARDNGCDVQSIGDTPDTGYFVPITLVGNIRDGVRLVDEEQFGPVLPIITYRDVDDAVASANRLGAALGASVWGESEQAQAVAAQLEAGTVWVNQHGAIHPMVPFGGAKRSGYGVEFGVDGLKAVTQPKVISVKK